MTIAVGHRPLGPKDNQDVVDHGRGGLSHEDKSLMITGYFGHFGAGLARVELGAIATHGAGSDLGGL